MTRRARSSLSGRESLADGLVCFTLHTCYLLPVSWDVVSVRNINGGLHVFQQLIQTQKINFYLFHFFTIVEPPLIPQVCTVGGHQSHANKTVARNSMVGVGGTVGGLSKYDISLSINWSSKMQSQHSCVIWASGFGYH
jgi:hypothetical protein